MEMTDCFALPLIAPSQAQKHVTHNEAVSMIDGLLHLVLDSIGLNAPPPGAVAPAAHAVGSAPTGDWTGHAGDIALLIGAGWIFVEPRPGIIAYRSDLGRFVTYGPGGDWENIASHIAITRLETLGIGADPDSFNKLVVKSNAALLTAIETAYGGNGDIRLTLNREATGDVAALLFQTGYAGRAEMGLSGGADAFELKTSPDGSAWTTALKATTAGSVEIGDLKTPAGAIYWNDGNDGSGSGLTADKVQAYATGALPSASSRGAGALILVTGPTPAILAYSDGTDWRATTDAGVVS